MRCPLLLARSAAEQKEEPGDSPSGTMQLQIVPPHRLKNPLGQLGGCLLWSLFLCTTQLMNRELISKIGTICGPQDTTHQPMKVSKTPSGHEITCKSMQADLECTCQKCEGLIENLPLTATPLTRSVSESWCPAQELPQATDLSIHFFHLERFQDVSDSEPTSFRR